MLLWSIVLVASLLAWWKLHCWRKVPEVPPPQEVQLLRCTHCAELFYHQHLVSFCPACQAVLELSAAKQDHYLEMLEGEVKHE